MFQLAKKLEMTFGGAHYLCHRKSYALNKGRRQKTQQRVGRHDLWEDAGRRAGIAPNQRKCACGAPGMETPFHFCMECPQYSTQRQDFLDDVTKLVAENQTTEGQQAWATCPLKTNSNSSWGAEFPRRVPASRAGDESTTGSADITTTSRNPERS